MFNEIRIIANAKINIGLAVGEPLSDGYHPIVSIFQAVSLYDELGIKIGSKAGDVTIAGAFDCLPENTTVYKAARLFLDELGENRSVDIEVKKRIPARAGMGGGSSDAAAVLAGLNRLHGNPLDEAQLARLGKKIGADVSYFILGKGTALVSGIGDIVEPIPTRTDFGIVIVLPDMGISTPWAYNRLDQMRHYSDIGIHPGHLLEAKFTMRKMYYEALTDWDFVNDFHEIALADFPNLMETAEALKAQGAILVSLTGSGSGIFGIFENDVIADQAAASLKIPQTQGIMPLKPLETTLELG